MTPEQNKLMEQCRAEAPYTVLKLSDRYTPTYVIQGGPVHIAAFWVTEREAQSECDLLNAVHAQALFDERSKATKVLTDEELKMMVDTRLPEVYDPMNRTERNIARNGGYTILVYASDNGYLVKP